MNIKNNVSLHFKIANFMNNTLKKATTGRDEKAMDLHFPWAVVYLTSGFCSVTASVYLALSASFSSGFST